MNADGRSPTPRGRCSSGCGARETNTRRTMDTEKTTIVEDYRRRATAFEHLAKAAYFAELAAESLSPVEGQAERWERVRELVFALRDERDALLGRPARACYPECLEDRP